MNPPSRLPGYLAMLATVAIWAFWIVGTRQVMATRGDTAVIGLLRFGVPVLVFIVPLLRIGLKPASLSWGLLGLLLLSGAPFFLSVATAMRFAPAADIGPLLPGTMPLTVALLAYFIEKEPIGRLRALGFALVLAGGIAIFGRGLLAGADGAWRGHLLALGAGFLWAIYTIAFKRSRLSATAAAGIVAAWTVLLFLPLGLPGLWRAAMAGEWSWLGLHFVLQGLLSGSASIWLFGVGVTRLGSTRASAMAALTPTLAALIAIPWLGEIPDWASILGIALTTTGVLLASGVLGEVIGGRATNRAPAG